MAQVPALLLTVLIFGGFFALIIWLRRREAVGLCNAFVAAGSSDARVKGDDTVIGTVQGVRMTCTIYQGGKHSHPHTVLEAPTPAGMPACEIHLFPQDSGDQRRVERGVEIDVEIGDPRFDAAVVVEAAPAGVVRAVLDDHLRACVLQMMPCQIDVTAGNLHIRKRGRITNAYDVRTLTESVAYLSARLGQVGAELGAERMAAMAQQGVGGYRGVGASAADAAFGPPGAADELAHLQAVRARRTRNSQALFWAVAGGIILVWVFVAKSTATKNASSAPPVTTKPATDATKPAPTPAATAHSGTFRDTEGRSFYERGGSGAVAYVDPAKAGVVPLASANPAYGTPAFGLWFDTHFARVCDGYRDGTGLRAVYEGCRPVTCNADSDCPTPRGETTMIECIHGWCGVRAAPMDVNDVVAACMAGTGPDWRSASQRALVQKARACKHSPCTPPPECKVP